MRVFKDVVTGKTGEDDNQGVLERDKPTALT
jgi:hypothetical protein